MNLEFRLFDHPTVGNQIGAAHLRANTPLTNGFFTVTLNDGSPPQFGTSPFNGEARWIEVRVNGTPLVPRQPVTAAPYASYSLAGKPGNSLDASDGSPPNAVSVDAIGNVGIGTGAPLAKAHVTNGSLPMPIPPSAMSSDTLILESTSDTQLGIYSDALGGWGSGITLKEIDAGALTNGWAIIRRTTFGDASLRFTYGSGANPTGNQLKMKLSTNGYLGIGDVSPAVPLHIAAVGNPGVRMQDLDPGGPTYHMGIASDDTLRIAETGIGDRITIARTTGNVGIGTSNPATKLDVNGTAKVTILQITGADLAEKFPTSEDVAPGMVVAIDPHWPGQVCLARGAYNPTVAGIVSGANNFAAGAVLGNLPESESSPAVALSGRVYAWCDASTSAIEPGDLLTTSDTPGHAMKAIDRERRDGAVLGKAMTSLPQGEKGLVLVLVSLQ